MQELYEDIRKDAEKQGYSMTDRKFTELVQYAERKAAVAGKDESYIPYLLPDVIKEYFIRNAINEVSTGMMEFERYIKTQNRRLQTMAEMTEKQWLSGVQSSIIKELTTHKAALPAGFNQERFALNTVTVISEMLKDKKKKTELCKLTFESMAVCLCKAAYLGLDYFNGECYAIPYGGELNFQTDYKGEIKMCKRFSRNPIKDIFAKVVRQDDFFTEEVDAGVQNVIYRPQPFSNKPMIGAFAIVVFKDGSMMYDTMSVEEIENVRNTYSKAKDSQAWKSSTGEMYKKTVLRRLCKLIDLDFDNIEQQKAYLAGGDVEFENGQPVFIDGRTATAALPDNGAPVDVFAQMEQAKKEPVPVEQSQPQETKEPTQQAIPFEQQQEEQPQPMPDGTGFMMPDESAMDDLPWK